MNWVNNCWFLLKKYNKCTCTECWWLSSALFPASLIDKTHQYLRGCALICLITLMWELHPKPNLSLFCVLSQNYQHRFEEWFKHGIANCLRDSKMELKFETNRSWVIEQNNILHVLINNSRPIHLLEFQCHFRVPWTICFRMHTLVFKKCWQFWGCTQTC